MYSFLAKYGQTFAFGLGILLTAIFLLSAFGGLEQFNMQSEEEQWTTGIFDIGFYAVIALTILCFAAAVLFGLAHMFMDLKTALKGIIGVVALLAIFFIIYSSVDPAADSAGVMREVKKFDVTDGQSKFISASVITTITLAAIALVSFIVFEIINLFK